MNYMDYLSSKGIIKEARISSEQISYKIDKKKEKVEAIVSSDLSSQVTKVFKTFDNLKKASERMEKKLKEANIKAKEKFQELFDSADMVNQLIVKSLQYTATLAKATKREASKEKVTDYKKAWTSLIAVLSDDLQPIVDSVIEACSDTKTIEAKEQDFLSRGLRVTKIEESMTVKGFISMIKKLYNKVLSFKDKYISKLDKIIASVK